MPFTLAIVEAKRNFFPVVRKNKKTGEVVIDKETGKPKIDLIPGGYSIVLNDGTKVSVTPKKLKSGRKDDDGRDILVKDHLISVTIPGSPITDRLGRPTGGFTPPKKELNAVRWGRFARTYNHCRMPALVVEGMQQADEELAERRAG